MNATVAADGAAPRRSADELTFDPYDHATLRDPHPLFRDFVRAARDVSRLV